MSKGSIDDNDPQVAYTGSWRSMTNPGSSPSSLHSTTQSGASATVHFTGFTGRVLGTVSPCFAEADQVSVTIVLDDSVVGQVTKSCIGGTNQDGVLFYDSGLLSGGNQQHKLAVVNQGSFPFQLDNFVWAGGPETASPTTAVAALTPTGNPSVMRTSGSSIATSQSSSVSLDTTDGSSTISISLSMVSGIPLAAGADVTARSSMQIVTINGVVTSINAAPSTGSAPTGTNDIHGASAPSAPPIGLIIGCVIAVLLFIILLIILLFYCIRRRRRRHHTNTQPTSSPQAITPFQLVEGTNNSSTHLGLYPDVEQRRLSVLPPAEMTGKPDQLAGPISSSQAAARRADEKGPLPQPEESHLPSSEPQSSTLRESLVGPAPRPTRPPSTVSSYPSEVAPAYRPRYQSDMSTFFNLGLRASLIAEAPPSYDS
ncbi:hypothetical protein M413DRAFT_442302 [Hebeloma cylindrosporum]|uniref:Uncharacterized protein n=1 Tax=Hebeloma cylindrosporum TaxID=76867 RepID=A0A0C2YXI0_HEBCY|nr:hypothetical protein M413DRAFT_442302 [Hebeloma cylindrosporum h7]